MKTIGLTLSGGAIRGVIHLGVIKALEENGIKPTVITGTSMGSIIGGLYACGLSYNDILEIVKTITPKIYDIDWKGMASNIFKKQLPNGIIKGDKVEQLIDSMSKGITLNDITLCKLGIVATNLNGGENVIFTNSEVSGEGIKCIKDVKLSKAIRSSMSLPFIFKPVIIDDYVLVDGGIVNNCPVNIAQDLGAEYIIVSDIDYGGSKVGTELDGADILLATLDVIVKEACEDDFQESAIPRLVINFGDIPSVSMFDFTDEDIDNLFNIGYERTNHALGFVEKGILD